MDKKFILGEYIDLHKRKINEATLRKFNGKDKNTDVQIANYYDKEFNLVAQHTLP